MEKEAIKYWLILLRTPGLGSCGINHLLKCVSCPASLFINISATLSQLNLKQCTKEHLLHPNWKQIEPDLAWLEKPHNHLITIDCPSYPPLLKEVPDPPPALFVHGSPRALLEPQLAIVGSRNPSQTGERIAKEFSQCLGASGLTITSGMAIGIDAAAHRGALEAGGSTIAVAGTGLDRVYPARHHELAHQIAQQGALVSEFPPGTPPKAGHFPRRNRIISGLSLGTLVVEAALQSGSLITARQATEQGREVFAIPGSIHNPLAKGCHQLIREGAKLVETAQDIIEELSPLLSLPCATVEPHSAPSNGPKHALDPDYQRLIRNVGFDPAPIDQIMANSGLTAEEVCSMLLLLELEGYVSSAPGGNYVRTGKEFDTNTAGAAISDQSGN